MRVVIDTNVVVSAALKDKEPEAVILFVAEGPDFEWIVSTAILEEYKAILGRAKFGLPGDILRKWNEMFDALTAVVETNIKIDFLRDRKDAKFLECALAADAAYFITGDKDFGEAQKLVSTTIIPVSMFKKLVVDSWR